MEPLLRKIIESTLGPITNSEFKEILDLATTDIKKTASALVR